MRHCLDAVGGKKTFCHRVPLGLISCPYPRDGGVHGQAGQWRANISHATKVVQASRMLRRSMSRPILSLGTVPMRESASSLIEAFQRYRDQWQGDADVVAQFEAFAQTHPDAFERSNQSGHFTGSAWLVRADGTRVWLMQDRKSVV